MKSDLSPSLKIDLASSFAGGNIITEFSTSKSSLFPIPSSPVIMKNQSTNSFLVEFILNSKQTSPPSITSSSSSSPQKNIPLDYIYVKGLSTCSEDLFQEIRLKFLDICEWAISVIKSPDSEIQMKIAATDIFIGQFQSTDFAIFSNFRLIQEFFKVIMSVEESLVTQAVEGFLFIYLFIYFEVINANILFFFFFFSI